MKKTILAILLSLLMITSVFAASAVIGDGTSTTNYMPSYGYFNNSWSHFILPGDAITNAIDITNIEFNVSNSPSYYARENQTVYLKLTTATTVTADYTEPITAGFTEIYTGSMIWNGSGWQGIELTTPFAYDGTSNLEIIWEDRDGGYSSGYPYVYTTSSPSAGAYKYLDANFPEVAGTSFGYYPNTRLTWEVAGEPDAPTLVSPISGTMNVAIDTNLEWTTGENTDHSVLYIADNAEFTAATIVNPAPSPYTTSLTNGTTYFWKVVAVGTTTPAIETNSAVRSFTTAFGAITDFPYDEGFEGDWVGSPSAPLGWSQITVSGANPWVSYSSTPHSGTKCAKAPYAYAGGQHLLITPTFDLEDGTDYRLKFWLKGSADYDVTSLTVQIASDYVDETSFTDELAYFTGGDSSNMPTVWTEQIISLVGYTGNQTIAFRLIDANGYHFYIDDVTIEEIPESPIVQINTDPIEFGSVPMNDSSDTEFVSIQNIGGGTLNITDASLTGTDADQFNIMVSEDYALAATEELVVEVTFNPTSAGAKTATLQITDDLSREVYEIALTGTSVDTDIYEISIPYTQDFETEETFLGWTSVLDSDNALSKSERYSSSSSAHAGTYSHRFYHSGSATYTNAELISPIVVPDMDAYRVKFWAKNSNSSNTDSLLVGKYNQAMDTFTAYSTLELTTSYAEYTVNMNAPVRANERIAFQANFSGAYQTIYIDDILFEEAPEGALVQITPDAHEFGDVFIAGSVSQTFTVTNNGVISAEITEVSVPVGYSYETSEIVPLTLGVQESFTVTATFAPLAEMMYSGNLAVKETNPNNLFVPIMHNVALTGTGVPVPEGDNHNNPFILTLADSVTVTGSTTDFQNYYSFVSSQSVVYQLTIPTDKLMSLSLDGTAWDTKLWIFNSYQQIDDATTLATATAWYYNDDEGSASTGGDRTKARDRANWSKMLETYTPAGEYYIVLAGYNTNNGDYTLTVETADIPLPVAVTNPSPATEAISVATSTTLSWTNPNYTNNIDLYLGTPDNMTLVLDNVEAVEEYLATDLSTNTTYNWKVIARNITGDTPLEEVTTWSFTTVGQAPEAVVYTAPADDATAIALNGNLTWSATTGAEGYNVYFSTNDAFTGVTEADVEGTSYAFSGLEYSTTYYWKVIPYNAVGSTIEGIEVWSFTTIPDPTLPMPVSINFEGTTANPVAITLANLDIEIAQGSTSNIMTKNIFSATTSAYIQFQSMNNITATSIFEFEYRFVDYSYSGPWPGIDLEAGHDYLIAQVSVDNGATFTTIDQINSLNHTTSDDFVTYTIDISPYAGQTVMFRLDMPDDTVNDYEFNIDNIYFGEPATAPIAMLSTTEIDFGTVGVGETASGNVSISNAGVGTLNISTIEIVGANADEFSFTTDDEASMALTDGQILAITLEFSPLFEGQRDATLEITDDLGRTLRFNSASNDRNVNAVTLTGEGFIPAQGSVCSNPLPLEFPAVDVIGNTGDFGDDYSSNWVTPSSSYLNGDDVVYQFTLENDMLLNGTIVAGGTWMGVFILEDAPNATTPAEVVDLQIASSGYSVAYSDVLIPAGTYYMIISTYPNPQSIDYTINLTASVPAPEIPVNVTITATEGVILNWDAVVNASSYNVYASSTPDGEFTMIPNASVSELSYTYEGTENMKFFKVKASTEPAGTTPAKRFGRRN